MENWISTQLDTIEQKGNTRTLRTKPSSTINLSGNDYLGIATDKDLRYKFLEQINIDNFFLSSSSSRLLTGNNIYYELLEAQISALYEGRSALIFNSGYHANCGILSAITSSKSLIVADKLVHASMIDGMQLAPCEYIRYRHNDYNQLWQIIDRRHSDHDRIVVVTESLFSMDGDTCDFESLIALKKAYPNVLLYVDEAHAVGVYGATGQGYCQQHNCMHEIDLIMGTMGKAWGSVGAYLISSPEMRSLIINKTRTLIYSTALPPISLQWSSFVLTQHSLLSQRRIQLQQIANNVRRALPLTKSSSHIVPYIVGESHAAIQLSIQLEQLGYYCLAVRPPTVPAGTARLRLSLTTAIDETAYQHFIDTLTTLCK